METLLIRTTSELQTLGGQWDDLWERSDCTLPMARSEPLAHAIDHFYGPRSFCGLAILDRGRMLAALPLAIVGIKKCLPVAVLPNNAWGRWGDLLIDSAFPAAQLCGLLANALQQVPAIATKLCWIPENEDRWQRLRDAISQRGSIIQRRPSFYVGVIDTDRNWASYESRMSSDHRKQIRRYTRRLEEQGELRCQMLCELSGDQLMHHVRRGFDLEDRGWKGGDSSSVLQSEGMFDFYLEQAARLSNSGMFAISFLSLGNQDIAFEFGALAKNVYYSWKVGYEPQHTANAPGQVLMSYLTRAFHQRQNCLAQHTMGPLSLATRKWSTQCLLHSNWLVSNQSRMSQVAVGSWSLLARASDSVRGRTTELAEPVPGVAPLASVDSTARVSAAAVRSRS